MGGRRRGAARRAGTVTRIGRPPLPPGDGKESILSVRLKPNERSAVDAAAAHVNKKPSAWARDRLVDATEILKARKPRAPVTMQELQFLSLASNTPDTDHDYWGTLMEKLWGASKDDPGLLGQVVELAIAQLEERSRRDTHAGVERVSTPRKKRGRPPKPKKQAAPPASKPPIVEPPADDHAGYSAEREMAELRRQLSQATDLEERREIKSLMRDLERNG